MRTILLVATVIGALVPTRALPAEVLWSGEGFMEGCRSLDVMLKTNPEVPVSFDTAFGAGFCYGIVNSVAATISPELACLPAGSSTTDHVAVMVKFIDEYRESLGLDESSPSNIAIQGLVVEYPCPK